MTRIIWKENRILSIETRKGLFVLAQMIKEPNLLFFNIFSKNQHFKDFEFIDTKDLPILFYSAVAREFINSSNIVILKNIIGIERRELNFIRIKTESIFRKIKIWKGTDKETELLIMGKGGFLINKNPYLNNSIEDEIVIQKIEDSDDLTIEKAELDRILFYPLLNERLFLCYKFNKNVDPLKDLVFNREILEEYDVYIKLYTDKLTDNDWEDFYFN